MSRVVEVQDDASHAGALAAAFRAWTGSPPEGVWRAPGRVNLIGEHLDYNGGHVLPFAMDRSAWVALRRHADPVLRARSRQYRDPVAIPLSELTAARGWGAHLAGVLWALGTETTGGGGVDIFVDSDVPPGGGLSSSAALECATALALADLAGAPTGSADGRRWLASVAQRAESTVVGAPIGIMDQTAVLLAQADHAMYLDTRTLEAEQVPLRPSEHGYRLLVVDTGSPHAHSTNGYAQRRRACEAAAAAIGVPGLALASRAGVEGADLPEDVRMRARHVVSEEARTRRARDALRRGRYEVLGRLMTASHRSMQHDFENSTAAMDAVVDASLAAGAAGARMTGGGWGGAAIILAPTAAVAAVTAGVEDALQAAPGAPDPVRVLETRPSAGAERVG